MTAIKTKSKSSTVSSTKKSASKSRAAKAPNPEPVVAKKYEPEVTEDIDLGSTLFDPPTFAYRDFLAEPAPAAAPAVEEISSGIADILTFEPPEVKKAQPTPPSPAEGEDNVSKKILARIVSLAAQEIPGILPAKKDIPTRIEDLIRGRIGGIRVDVGTTEAAVDILTRVYYGTDIPQATARLRDNIARRIWEMTGLHVLRSILLSKTYLRALAGGIRRVRKIAG